MLYLQHFYVAQNNLHCKQLMELPNHIIIMSQCSAGTQLNSTGSLTSFLKGFEAVAQPVSFNSLLVRPVRKPCRNLQHKMDSKRLTLGATQGPAGKAWQTAVQPSQACGAAPATAASMSAAKVPADASMHSSCQGGTPPCKRCQDQSQTEQHKQAVQHHQQHTNHCVVQVLSPELARSRTL